MSPTPDVIFVDSEPAEPAVDARAAEVRRVTNALLKKQQICGNCCHKCELKCGELERWINLDTEANK
jgi:hypothetical protein